MGSFFTKWLLPRLETTGATQELYWMLTIFTQISKDANLLLDLFVNYDCDFDQENLFQRYEMIIINFEYLFFLI